MQVVIEQEFHDIQAHRILCAQVFEITEYIKKKQDYQTASNLISQYQITFQILVKITQRLSLKELAKLGDSSIYK